MAMVAVPASQLIALTRARVARSKGFTTRQTSRRPDTVAELPLQTAARLTVLAARIFTVLPLEMATPKTRRHFKRGYSVGLFDNAITTAPYAKVRRKRLFQQVGA